MAGGNNIWGHLCDSQISAENFIMLMTLGKEKDFGND
jgi:hypothetical protein